MARRQGRSRPVSNEEYERMPDHIEGAFDRVRELMAEQFGGEPEDYKSDDLNQKLEQ